jgi:hypothetical protein
MRFRFSGTCALFFAVLLLSQNLIRVKIEEIEAQIDKAQKNGMPRRAAEKIFFAFNSAGPFNIRFLAQRGHTGEDLHGVFLKALLSAGYQIPQKKILLSPGALEEKRDFAEPARIFAETDSTLKQRRAGTEK